MRSRRQIALIVIGLVTVALIALAGALSGRRPVEPGQEEKRKREERCALDGTKVNPLYGVETYLEDGTYLRFASIESALKWLKAGKKDNICYFTVADEVTGQRLDAGLAHFVVSDVITVPEVGNRIHAFMNRQDALRHIEQFNGRLMENPFGDEFIVPRIAQLDKLRVAIPSLPDSLPIHLALVRPIFKENRLDVTVVQCEGKDCAEEFLSDESVDAILCDLPQAILLTQRMPSARIVKNVLRANPFRPLFALVASPNAAETDPEALGGKSVALAAGVTHEFYMDQFLGQIGIQSDNVMTHQVGALSEAWEMVSHDRVPAAVLRTPYIEMARRKGMRLLVHDRNLPWMSVLVVRQTGDPGKSEVIKRFLLSLEQAVLALNLKPDEFRVVLKNKGGIPADLAERFPMPIFEGANAPSSDEAEPIIRWLVKKRLLAKAPAYEQVVDTSFLPDPDSIGLAFCCR